MDMKFRLTRKFNFWDTDNPTTVRSWLFLVYEKHWTNKKHIKLLSLYIFLQVPISKHLRWSGDGVVIAGHL